MFKNKKRIDPRYFMNEKIEKTISEAGKPLPDDPGPYHHDPEAATKLDPAGNWDEYWADDNVYALDLGPEEIGKYTEAYGIVGKAVEAGTLPESVEDAFHKMLQHLGIHV